MQWSQPADAVLCEVRVLRECDQQVSSCVWRMGALGEGHNRLTTHHRRWEAGSDPMPAYYFHRPLAGTSMHIDIVLNSLAAIARSICIVRETYFDHGKHLVK